MTPTVVTGPGLALAAQSLARPHRVQHREPSRCVAPNWRTIRTGFAIWWTGCWVLHSCCWKRSFPSLTRATDADARLCDEGRVSTCVHRALAEDEERMRGPLDRDARSSSIAKSSPACWLSPAGSRGMTAVGVTAVTASLDQSR